MNTAYEITIQCKVRVKSDHIYNATESARAYGLEKMARERGTQWHLHAIREVKNEAKG